MLDLLSQYISYELYKDEEIMQNQNNTPLNKDNLLIVATRIAKTNLLQKIIDKQWSNKQILNLEKLGTAICIDNVLHF